MEATCQFRKPPSLLVFIVFCVIAYALVNVIITYGQHAVLKHGEDAVLVRKCMEDKGPEQIWAKDNKVYHVCMIDPDTWGIMITDGTREITSFIKNRMRHLAQVEQYLRNIGAYKVTFP